MSGYGGGIDKDSIAAKDCTGWVEKTGLIRTLGLFLATCLLAVMAGCASTPQKSVYSIASKYTAALVAVKAYTDLPNCNAAPPPCAQSSVIRKLDDAVKVAGASVDAAEDTVRDPRFDEGNAQAAQAAAEKALAALLRILAELNIEVKP